MKVPMKTIGIFIIIQIVIFITSLLYNNKVTLINYINITFYFASAFLLSALLIYVTRSGFFDVVTKGFTKAFSRNNEDIKLAEITPLSKLVSISQKSLFLHGLILFICMFVALILYYV
jgi:hypothetical protein